MQIGRFCFKISLQKLTVPFVLASILWAGYLYAYEKDFLEERSQHFIIRYDKSIDKNFIKDIIKSAEGYYDEIADNLGLRRFNFWLWDNRAQIYIFANKEEYVKNTGQPEWSGGCADYLNKKIWTYPHAAGFFDSLLPHELGHIMFRELAGSRRNIPLWLDEGVASYQEKSKRYAAIGIVKDALSQGKLSAIEELEKIKRPHELRDDKEAQLFYAQAVSIVYFLIQEYGKDRFVALCRYLKENSSLDNAINRTYYNMKNRQDLNDAWIRFLKR